jgi:hypothetical protein
MIVELVDWTAMLLAGILGALIAKPTTAVVRVTADRVRRNGRRR